MAVWPDSAKADKWLSDIDGALESGRLCCHDAAKLAGRLSFTAQNSFFRLGRAMLRPIFQQQYKPLSQGRARPALRMALRWWRQALAHGVGQRRRLEGRQGVVDIFCDAASTQAKMAAVLVAETGISYTVWTPDEELVGRFLQRKDKQICGLELLGALLGKQLFISPRTRRVITTHCAFIGIITFLKDCKTVRLWTDNDGGLGALVRGSAGAEDHNAIVHAVWLMAAANRIGLFVGRVSSRDNISDYPAEVTTPRCNHWVPLSVPVDPCELWSPGDWENVVRYW